MEKGPSLNFKADSKRGELSGVRCALTTRCIKTWLLQAFKQEDLIA